MFKLNDSGMLTFTEDGLAMMNAVITDDRGPLELRAFILHAVLAGAEFEPTIADLMRRAILSALTNGVDETIMGLRIEEALVEGLL